MAQGWQGWRSGESAHLPPLCSGFDFRTPASYVGWVCCWFSSFSERFFKPTFPNSNSIWNCQALYHEPLARVTTQTLPVFDIKFDFDFTLSYFQNTVTVTCISMSRRIKVPHNHLSLLELFVEENSELMKTLLIFPMGSFLLRRALNCLKFVLFTLCLYM